MSITLVFPDWPAWVYVVVVALLVLIGSIGEQIGRDLYDFFARRVRR